MHALEERTDTALRFHPIIQSRTRHPHGQGADVRDDALARGPVTRASFAMCTAWSTRPSRVRPGRASASGGLDWQAAAA